MRSQRLPLRRILQADRPLITSVAGCGTASDGAHELGEDTVPKIGCKEG